MPIFRNKLEVNYTDVYYTVFGVFYTLFVIFDSQKSFNDNTLEFLPVACKNTMQIQGKFEIGIRVMFCAS